MGLTLAAIRRPVFISMFVLALVILGLRARNAMPKEANPDIESPYITVVTVYAGAGPQEIETLVTKPLEDAVAGVNGLKHMTSSSRDGLSVIALEFELGTDVQTAAADVRDKVSGARNSLPQDAQEPSVSRVNIAGGPVLTIGMPGTLPASVLRHIADTTVKDAFAKVPGAAAVYVDGGEVREIQVQVDKDRLQAYGMSLSQVVNAINQQNLNIPGGSVKETGREYAVRMVGEFTDPRQIEEVQIQVPARQANAKATLVRLGDVAKVVDTVAEPDRITRLGVKTDKPIPAVVIAVQRQSGANTLETATGVKMEMARLLGKVYNETTDQFEEWNSTMGGVRPVRILPQGIDMVVATDESTYVRDSLNDVNKSLVEGILLVVVIVFLFLHSGRATFIVGLAIPTSMVATFLPLHAMGHTMNFMTMLALSLAVGILVDDSIVVLENIERHLRKGEDPQEAALNGRSEIGLAAIAITMVDVVVFLPIAFMGGLVGQFFRPFGWTVAIATLFSLFMSFTLTPMLASRFFQKGHGTEETRATRRGFWAAVFNGFDRFYAALDNIYESLLAWTLNNRALTIWTGWAALVTVMSMMVEDFHAKVVFAIIVGVMLLMGIAFSRDKLFGVLICGMFLALVFLVRLPLQNTFFPDVDRGLFSVTIEGPSGQSLGTTDRQVARVAEVLRNLQDPLHPGKSIVEYAISTTGATSSGASQGSGDAGSQYGNLSVKLVDKKDRSETLQDVMRRVTQLTANTPGAKVETRTAQMGPGGKPITMEVMGSDMQDNVKAANALAAKMEGIKGLVDVATDWKVGKPELQINVDPKLAADRGITAAQAGAAARIALQGSGEGGADTKYREAGDQYTIRTQYAKLNRNNAGEVKNLIIGSSNGRPIYLKDVASITLSNAPQDIKRKDKQRLITVDANVASGYAQGTLQQMVTAAAKTVPSGSSTINVGGIGQMQAESMMYMISALGLAVVLVYMLMAALFESLTTPFVIWLTLPQALAGALLGLMVTNKAMSIVSMIGIIMLMGLVTKNAILLIDYTNTLRSRGKGRREAILEAGPTRLRPVMMTTLAMIGGMAPTALALGQGAEQRQPMAIAVIGGLILSTMLTLLVIPVTYTLMDDIVQGSHNTWLSLTGRRRRAVPEFEPMREPVAGE
ncbi:MAG TPA: efflux RND transporter permease subunit [Armatimonadota bacterium]|jgi:HAE1 family hydrophobic/amphiphilic exporter-1